MAAPIQTSDETVINGFTVVPVKFNTSCKACHYLYLKEHSIKDADPAKPTDRTLMILNVPPYVNESCLRRIFEECGHIEEIFLQKRPSADAPKKDTSQFFKNVPQVKGLKVAYIVFKKPVGVAKAKKLKCDQPRILSTEEHPIETGMKKWCKEYANRIPNIQLLQKEIDDYMAEYDRKVEEEKELEKSAAGEPDDEGWVTVTRHGKNKGAPRTEAQERRVTAKERKRRKEQELLSFYKFQMRESKNEHIAKLRQQFEQDKQKIALMKTSRKFKPY